MLPDDAHDPTPLSSGAGRDLLQPAYLEHLDRIDAEPPIPRDPAGLPRRAAELATDPRAQMVGPVVEWLHDVYLYRRDAAARPAAVPPTAAAVEVESRVLAVSLAADRLEHQHD